MNQCFAVIPPTVVTLMILLLTSMQGKGYSAIIRKKDHHKSRKRDTRTYKFA